MDHSNESVRPRTRSERTAERRARRRSRLRFLGTSAIITVFAAAILLWAGTSRLPDRADVALRPDPLTEVVVAGAEVPASTATGTPGAGDEPYLTYEAAQPTAASEPVEVLNHAGRGTERLLVRVDPGFRYEFACAVDPDADSSGMAAFDLCCYQLPAGEGPVDALLLAQGGSGAMRWDATEDLGRVRTTVECDEEAMTWTLVVTREALPD